MIWSRNRLIYCVSESVYLCSLVVRIYYNDLHLRVFINILAESSMVFTVKLIIQNIKEFSGYAQ